jgi:GH15 family glucan-1,4-alpha-glucosidase
VTASPGGAMPPESAIGDYGVIGDMRTAALVDRWGRMDWLCWPRFDSPPLLRRLLDPDAGGSWQVAPGEPFSSTRRYLPHTNVLETRFSCADGVAVAADFMVVPADPRWGSQIVRIVQAESGRVPISVSLRASSGFERPRAPLAKREGAVVIGDQRQSAAVVTASDELAVTADEATLGAIVRAGRPLVMVLAARQVDVPLVEHALAARDATVDQWRRWIATSSLAASTRASALSPQRSKATSLTPPRSSRR